METFEELFRLDEPELVRRGACMIVADSNPGFPCRVSLEDAEAGERLLLLSFMHQPASSPYRSSGPILVRAGARQASPSPGSVPQVLRRRLLSVRAYDQDGMQIDAEVVEGGELEGAIGRLFADKQASYLHVHNAIPGCYSCRIDRVGEET
jgi:Protein of unknown function (DUF1203).